MKVFVRAGLRRLMGVAVLAGLTASVAVAQCPVAAICTPGAASSPFASAVGDGIVNVTLGTINNTSLGYIDGYKDYACGTPRFGTTLNVGRSYTLSVRTSGAENVRAWLDYGNDGAFGTTDLIMTVNGGTAHAVTFSPPTTATLGQPLRLRISSDDGLGAVFPTSCSTPVFGQVEDYAVTLTANVSPPTAAFTTSGTTTCTGCVQFTDASQNLPTSWSWNFGDGSPLSTQQNPTYCYTAAGTYNVVLTTTNAAGNATSAATAITYNPVVPVAASCAPATSAYFGGYGVIRFRLGTIDNTSADGSAGYQDFSCPQRTRLVAGLNYPMTITTGGTNQHAIRVYVDSNNNGIFDATEQVYENLATPAGGVTATLTAPATTTPNGPLRLRIMADFVGANLGPCVARTNGQVEDYTVIIGPNTAPPVVDFTSNFVPGGCVNPITFTDQSIGLDAGSTWAWNFGDGQTSTTRNPTHQYASTGTYTVSLTVTNANGSTTTTKPNYVTVVVPCVAYCPSNGGPGMGGPPFSQVWITGVGIDAASPDPGGMTYPAFANSSPNPMMPNQTGYTDYTNQVATVRIGQTHTMTVIINARNGHRTAVWIDGNGDGDFIDNGEEVINYSTIGTMPTNPQTHILTFTLPTTMTTAFTPRQTRMRVLGAINNNTPNPCGVNIQNAEVEDYTVNILPEIIMGTREAAALPGLSVYPNPSLDGRLHLALADAAAAGAYTATLQNLLGATLLETPVRLMPGTDAVLDLGAVAKGVYLLRLRDGQGRTALRRVVRE